MATVLHLPIARPAEPTIASSSTAVATAWDVTINGIGYLLANSAQSPYARATAQYKKDQFDAAAEAGEQSLGNWWTRRQVSFHGGAGLLYYEQGTDDNPETRIRYDASKNVDPWTPGKLVRLPDTTLDISSGSTCGGLVGARRGTNNYAVVALGSSLSARVIPDVGAPSTITYTWGGATAIQSLVSDGKSYWAGATTGIYSGPIDNSAGGAKVWNAGTIVCLGWVKQRLMAGIDNAVHELVGGAPPVLPAAKYTHPNTDWQWTAFADSPRGILASGYSGDESAVFLFALDSAGAAPTLTSGVIAAQLPPGERVHSMGSFAGSTFVLGTSRGVRIGSFDAAGNIKYGPLTVTTTQPVFSLAGRGNYVYATGTTFDPDGESCLVRHDLGQPTDSVGRYAYAADILCPTAQTGTCRAVATVAGRMAFALDGYGLVVEGVGPGSGRTAWLRSSRIRFTTVEPKLFKYGRVRGTFPSTLNVYALTPSIAERQIMTLAAAASDPPVFNLPEGGSEWLQLRFEMLGAGGHELRSWLVQALPGAKRQRLIQVALRFADGAMDRNNVRAPGGRGSGFAALQALETLEEAGDVVSYECRLPYAAETRLCVIDRIEYQQPIQPTSVSGISGVAVVTLRTVD